MVYTCSLSWSVYYELHKLSEFREDLSLFESIFAPWLKVFAEKPFHTDYGLYRNVTSLEQFEQFLGQPTVTDIPIKSSQIWILVLLLIHALCLTVYCLMNQPLYLFKIASF